MTSFAALGLSEPLLAALNDKGYSTPTPIQAQAIPAILAGRDLMAAAQTGTGKTAGFALPMLERLAAGPGAASNHTRALILAPTRELAIQVHDSFVQYGNQLRLKTAVAYGGVAINPQMMKLRRGVDVLVATPGRLMDLYRKNAVRFEGLLFLVLDEADRMLDLGFINDIQEILDLPPAQRQNLLFSATFSNAIRELAQGFLRDPETIDISPRNATADTVQQWLHPVDKKRKGELLSHLIRTRDWRQVLVFVRTKRSADRLVIELSRDGIRASAFHGDMSQGWRAKALAEFKKGRVSVLIATDVAARGLDIEQLPQVVNFDLPQVPEDYVHRIGRTGRAGSKGRAISLVSADEVAQLRAIERLIRKRLTRDDIKGFEPDHIVPESPSPTAPVKKVKKPKKPKRSKLQAAAKGAKGKAGAKSKAGGKDKKPRSSRNENDKGKAGNASGGRKGRGDAASSGSAPAAGKPAKAGSKPNTRQSGETTDRPARPATPGRSGSGAASGKSSSGRAAPDKPVGKEPARRPRSRPAQPSSSKPKSGS